MPRAPLTEEQKTVLRDRLARARSMRGTKPPKVDAALAHHPSAIVGPFTPWTEDFWKTAPIEDCRARLALLKGDFERGSRIVGQRPDVNDPSTYRCFVCHKSVPERAPSGNGPGWVWKHDYLDPLTGLFKSVVIDTQTCHMVYVNDARLQQALKDLIAGRVAAPAKDDEQKGAA